MPTDAEMAAFKRAEYERVRPAFLEPYPTQPPCESDACHDYATAGCAFVHPRAGSEWCPVEGCRCIGLTSDGGLCEGCYVATK